MPKTRLRGDCTDVERAGLASSHCESCHQDEDYGYDMVEVDLPSGEYLTVCCSASRSLDGVDGASVLAALDAADSAGAAIDG